MINDTNPIIGWIVKAFRGWLGLVKMYFSQGLPFTNDWCVEMEKAAQDMLELVKAIRAKQGIKQ